MRTTGRSIEWRSLVAGALSLAVIGCMAIVVVALGAGYRPVVIKTGSMGDSAPVGSLVVAVPRAADDIEVGDIVVMRRPGAAPVTHRVVEIERDHHGPYAITQGDANPSPDAAPYRLGDDELVARWVAPGLGTAVEALRDPRLALGALGLFVLAGCAIALRRIWSNQTDHPDHGGGTSGRPLPPPLPGTHVGAGAARMRAVPSGTGELAFTNSTISPRPAGRGTRSRFGGPHGVGPRTGAERSGRRRRPLPHRRPDGTDRHDPAAVIGPLADLHVLGTP